MQGGAPGGAAATKKERGMVPEERLNGILFAFARDLGLDEADIRMRDGYTCLSVDSVKVVHIRLAGKAPDIDLFMELGEVPGAVRAAVCEDMLAANVLFQGTGGAALGLDPERGIATLTLRMAARGLERADFERGLEGFLDASRFWERRIAGNGTGADGPAEQGGDQALLRV